jgi:hypothetical protein
MEYEVLFYNGWVQPPAYYLVAAVEGDSPEQALVEHLDEITQEIRDLFLFDESWSTDGKLRETIYVLRENGLISIEEAKKTSTARRSARRNRQRHSGSTRV